MQSIILINNQEVQLWYNQLSYKKYIALHKVNMAFLLQWAKGDVILKSGCTLHQLWWEHTEPVGMVQF